MGYLILDSNQEIESPMQQRTLITATLLIPEATWIRYSPEVARILPKRLPQLLRRYGKYLTTLPRLGRNARTTLYQPSLGKEKMKRINVRLSTGSWAFLGTLAQVHGVSRCYLFNFLLSLEELEVADSIVGVMNAGVPAFHRDYKYILHLDLLNNRVKRRLQCEPDGIFRTLDYRDWYPS
ncbi:CopG family transcriptional regulator [Leptospira kmetyi]|uniref:DUF1564 domain-containing protein n=1 Tax=Leptospira kmetyi TaxID=408139 RepID=A0A2M9XR70_9LEPT|nr:DUF1564 domain-containing protein [Leptospira kmetyi]AYV58036.1 DUF1564 domain-containing protein [Leptospira kmetyi]PJZ41748.1 CopG family transcriptional regulator [Leptospira kmetyi]TGK14834.1 DUF1564 domain-containing protein [Leptospira kmetyi]TGK33553.1 DUF1564 domain-containing protein [Leptospira kmetyi]TGL69708.1 DUF1564 domain-containing protein [Leptospira kmetyi]